MIVFVFLSLAFSLLAVRLFLKWARNRKGVLTVTAVSLGAAFVSLLFSPVVFLHMAGTFLCSIICVAFHQSRLIVFVSIVAPLLAAYGFVFFRTYAELNELGKLRQDFPLESLANRLEYEHRQPRSAESSKELQLSDKAERRLATFEGRSSSNTRRYLFQSLHRHTQDQFVLAQGFGPVRMLRIRRDRLVLPDEGPIPVGAPPDDIAFTQLDVSADESLGSQSTTPSPNKKALVPLHFAGLENVFDEDRMGYFEDINHVAGFQSHRFTKAPGAANEPWRRSWKVVRLELIGLLRYDTPKAYVSDHLPRFDELAAAKTRELDDFEAAAIERLRTDESVVIKEAPERVRMVGSIRAANDCLKCHEVQRGELLGALTYELVPIAEGLVQ